MLLLVPSRESSATNAMNLLIGPRGGKVEYIGVNGKSGKIAEMSYVMLTP
jgi:hypothetical protein